MDAQTLKQNWNQIKTELEQKFPDAKDSFQSAPSNQDALVSSISSRTGRDESDVRRDVEQVLRSYS